MSWRDFSGATTFWERFDPQWEDSGALTTDDPPVNAMNQDTSMSHPWATGATSFLSKHGLGLQPVEPGFAAWQAVPLLLDNQTMMSWVKGAVPTPHGPITVDFDLRSGARSHGALPRSSVSWVGFSLRCLHVLSSALVQESSRSPRRQAPWSGESASRSLPGVGWRRSADCRARPVSGATAAALASWCTWRVGRWCAWRKMRSSSTSWGCDR